jgi:acetate kinase
MIEAAMELVPSAPAIAVFDTAFHQTMPEIAWRYALPRELADSRGLRRFGFHGISYQYVSSRLLELLNRGADGSKMIICHLGNGASVCALRDGKSVDTSMGMTPLEGLVMGSRSGDVDPGLVLNLLRASGMTPRSVDDLLNYRSGLLGLSGRSGDVQVLEHAVSLGDAPAETALEIFAYRVAKYIGAYTTALEGLDAIAFFGGIGEHSADVRKRACKRLAFLGLQLDDNLNAKATGSDEARISPDGAAVQAWVIPTNEELQIARNVIGILNGS